MNRCFHRGGLLVVIVLCAGFAKCGSNPNLEGARLDLGSKDYNRALENVGKALEADPNSSEALMLKGDILREIVRETRDSEERLAYVREMAGAYRSASELDQVRGAEIERNLLFAYLQEFNRGIEDYSSAQHAEAELASEAFSEAAARFHGAALLMPDSVAAYVNEAFAHHSGGAFSRAVEAYEAALALGHTSRQLYVYMARMLELMADQVTGQEERIALYRRAARVTDAALEQYPQDPELGDMSLNFYALADKPEVALAHFGNMQAEKSTDPVFWYNYGTLLLRTGDYPEAVRKLMEAIRLDPEYTKARFNLGAAMVNRARVLAQTEEAIRDSLDMMKREDIRAGRTRLEGRQQRVSADRETLLQNAIEHLLVARVQAEDALEDPTSICKALYRAYGQANRRSDAEAVASCAGIGGS